ncbi:cell division control protein 2 homolog 3-like isoform X3 [Coccinella septempunctata]|uniref:cell division control protein 2 homolog 3-like isoform X3 n=1 Tax=Coccinella septempunctata TaxID=41139 RepID=UPI001D06FD9F|nr:cell division control protein 2 homolog 3-like isoform X3 [Coccinella septempunctata]XP_044761067.1 cell division control protein 2 homolog 3-like isoform X3 [Coccinella septempunctata]
MEKYCIEAILGEGGFGRVFSARERGQEGQRRAIKEVHLDPLAAREAEFMGLFDHCNIIPLIETLVEPPHLYLVLPLCEEDLGTFLVRKGPRRGPSSFFRVVRQIAVGLAECHRHGVVHRDLKPGNVLRRGARFMLADFGVAEQITPCRPLLTELAGTPVYWSPEQHRREPYNTAVDLWALGLVAMDVATGRPCRIDGQATEHWASSPGEERQRELAQLHPSVVWFVEGLLMDEPSLRRSADQWEWPAVHLSTVVDLETTPAPPSDGPWVVRLPPDLAHRLDTAPQPPEWTRSLKRKVRALLPGSRGGPRARHRFRFPSGSVRRIWVPPETDQTRAGTDR